MIAPYLTTSNITFAIGILAIIFSVYRSFRDPQVKEDKRAALLTQQVAFQNESTDRRFKDMQDSFQELLLQSNNHIHTVETKVDALDQNMTSMTRELVRVGTIIEERIPRK